MVENSVQRTLQSCRGDKNPVGATNGTKPGAHISVRHQTQKYERSHYGAASNSDSQDSKIPLRVPSLYDVNLKERASQFYDTVNRIE